MSDIATVATQEASPGTQKSGQPKGGQPQGLKAYQERKRLEKEQKLAQEQPAPAPQRVNAQRLAEPEPLRNLPVAAIAQMPNPKDADRPIIPIESDNNAIYDGLGVVFVSKYAGLTFTLEQTERLPSGINNTTLVPVRFNAGPGGGRFGADNEDLAELMRRHPCFGGSAAKNFTDRTSLKGEPMFWEGGFPDWYLKAQKAEQDDIKYNEGENEVGDPLNK